MQGFFVLHKKNFCIRIKKKTKGIFMRAAILKAVANPPKIIWAPVLPALINLGFQFPMMFITIGVGDVNPLLFVISIVSVHVGIILLGNKEPHISRMIQAFGQTNRTSKNLYKEKGNKFVP